MKKKDDEKMDDNRRAFFGKVAAVSIATAFGGSEMSWAQPKPTQAFKITKKGTPPDHAKPEGSVLEEGDLGKLAQVLNEHPDAAIRAVMKETVEGLATKEEVRTKFGQDVHGALKSLSIDVPRELLPERLVVPASVIEAKRKGWGIGGGHSNWNRWTQHNNHTNYSDYSDWW